MNCWQWQTHDEKDLIVTLLQDLIGNEKWHLPFVRFGLVFVDMVIYNYITSKCTCPIVQESIAGNQLAQCLVPTQSPQPIYSSFIPTLIVSYSYLYLQPYILLCLHVLHLVLYLYLVSCTYTLSPVPIPCLLYLPYLLYLYLVSCTYFTSCTCILSPVPTLPLVPI